MQSHVVRKSTNRITETPSATMTTLASPTQGAAKEISLWQVTLAAASQGPKHIVDTEQIWTLLSGFAVCHIDGTYQDLHPGDTIRIGPDIERQFSAVEDSQFIVCGRGTAKAWVPGGAESVIPPWIK